MSIMKKIIIEFFKSWKTVYAGFVGGGIGLTLAIIIGNLNIVSLSLFIVLFVSMVILMTVLAVAFDIILNRLEGEKSKLTEEDWEKIAKIIKTK